MKTQTAQAEDVYSANAYPARTTANLEANSVRANVTLEHSPMSLLKLFSLLNLLDAVPSFSQSTLLSDGSLNVQLSFANISITTADRLERKIGQLIELIHYRIEKIAPQS